MPKVSICIPTYNRKDYLMHTLDSVFAQTYKDYEVVVVDDGSTDGTEEMIKNVGYDVRYYWQENRGDAAARNRLVELAKGEFIAFLDSDDLYFPNSLERLITATETKKDMVAVYGPYEAIDKDGNVYKRKKRISRSGFITKYLFQTILVHPGGSLFPKKMLKEEDGFNESLPFCSDYELWLRLSLKYCFVGLDQPTFKRRRHSSNISKNSFANRKVELDVLTDFYYNGGGKEAVPKYLAMKRLSQEGYRAARYALMERMYEQARQLLSQSFRRYPNVKSLIYWTRAVITKKLASS